MTQRTRLAAAVRDACVAAAIEGYERAGVAGLCHEGAWEAAVEAMRRLVPEELAGLAADRDDCDGQS